MTPSPLTPDQFDALCQANGLSLTPERRERLRAVCPLVDAIRARLWRTERRFDEESALVFTPAGARLRGPEAR